MSSRPRSVATLATFGALLAAAPLSAAPVSPDVTARLEQGPVDLLVFFHDKEPTAATRRFEATPDLIPRLQRNMAASLAALDAVLPAGAEARREPLWISNAVALTADAAGVAALAAHPEVKRIDWDEPVSAPPLVEEPAGAAAPEGSVTYGLAQLKIPEVREQYGLTGAGVTVGHLDTGIDPDHPALQGRLKRYKNFRGWGSSPTDSDGHGTHTAGTIAGNDESGKSIGVAPGAKLVVGRVIGWSFTGAASGLLKGMQWQMDPDGKPGTQDQPRVVSMSWHSGGGNQNPFYEAIRKMELAGMIPSFSAGNSGSSGLTHPKEYPGNFVTAAVNSSGTVASFSSRGPATYKGRTVKKPDWSAPGVSVYSAKTGGGYTRLSGTSMACPHVSGVIALMLEADPSLTPSEVRQILYETSIDAGADGWDGSYGMGRIDALAAIERVQARKRMLAAEADPLTRELDALELLRRIDLYQELLD